jgi:DNA-binding transcriptional ArsR family regulator
VPCRAIQLYNCIVYSANRGAIILPHPLPDELVDLDARRLRAVAEPMRIRLLDHLRDGEATVGDLSDALGASQQNVSKHLAVLPDASVVGSRRDGNHVLYRIVDESVLTLCETVCGSLEQQLQTLTSLIRPG